MPKTPPHPDVITAQRFFARIRSFDCECPHCGLVYRIRADTPSSTWNARTAEFRCGATGGCGYRYVAGLLLWPKGTGKGAGTPPLDQVPGPRQLSQMRGEGDGWWMPEEYRHRGRPDPTNLTGEESRPEPEDESDLQLIDGVREYRCQTCWQPYSPKRSKANRPELYCSPSCEGE